MALCVASVVFVFNKCVRQLMHILSWVKKVSKHILLMKS